MSSHGQDPIEGTTKDGRKVVLKHEGTWEFTELAPRRRFKARKEIGMYVAWVAASLLCITGAYVFEHELHWKLRSHILTEIGIAGVVAFILAITIEYVSRKRDARRFKEEKEAIKNDVFEYVLGHRLPEGTFAELDNQILNAWFIRKDFTCSYRLVPLKEATGTTKFMKVEATLTYEIVNRTPERKLYPFYTITERAPVEELDSLVKFISVSVKGCESPVELDTEEKISKAVDRNIRPNHLVIQKDISILGNTFASAVVRFEAVRVFEGGSEFLLHKLQTAGFCLRVEAPPDIEVSASAFLPESLGESAEHNPDLNRYHWVLKNPILPYQGVYVTWKSKAGANQTPQVPTEQLKAPGTRDAGKVGTPA